MTTSEQASSEQASSDVKLSDERADLLDTLGKHRYFLRYTTRDLTDEQIGRRTTVSELCLGGLIKHVTIVEQMWARFIVEGPSVMGNFSKMTEADWAKRVSQFQVAESETLAGLLAEHAETAKKTDELVASLPSLDTSQPLPQAPWFEPNARWSARRVLLHIIAETAQHAGHADILREAIDGAKSM